MNLKYLYHLFPGVLKGVRALGRVRTEGEVSPYHRREYKIIKVHKKNLYFYLYLYIYCTNQVNFVAKYNRMFECVLNTVQIT